MNFKAKIWSILPLYTLKNLRKYFSAIYRQNYNLLFQRFIDGSKKSHRPELRDNRHIDLSGLLYFGGIEATKRSRAVSQGVTAAQAAPVYPVRDSSSPVTPKFQYCIHHVVCKHGYILVMRMCVPRYTYMRIRVCIQGVQQPCIRLVLAVTGGSARTAFGRKH